MIKATDLKGKAIISVDSASKLGEVDSAFVDPEARRIVALQVDAKDSREKLAIPTDSIRTVGADAITVEGLRSLVHPSRIPEVALGSSLDQLIGATVVTEGGKSLGKISDVYLDEKNLNIIEYELSGDLWQMLSQDRPTFRPGPGMRLGQSMLIVPDQVERSLAETTQAMGGRERADVEQQRARPEATTTPVPPVPPQANEPRPRAETEYYAAPDSKMEMRQEELNTEQKVIEQRMRQNQQQLQQLEEERRKLRQTYEQAQQSRPEIPNEQRYAAPPPTMMPERAEPQPYDTRQASYQPTQDEELLRKHIEEDRRLLESLQHSREMGEPPQRT